MLWIIWLIARMTSQTVQSIIMLEMPIIGIVAG
jgi:hypothetical protein